MEKNFFIEKHIDNKRKRFSVWEYSCGICEHVGEIRNLASLSPDHPLKKAISSEKYLNSKSLIISDDTIFGEFVDEACQDFLFKAPESVVIPEIELDDGYIYSVMDLDNEDEIYAPEDLREDLCRSLCIFGIRRILVAGNAPIRSVNYIVYEIYNALSSISETLNLLPRVTGLNSRIEEIFITNSSDELGSYTPDLRWITINVQEGDGETGWHRYSNVFVHEWAHHLDFYLDELCRPQTYATQRRGGCMTSCRKYIPDFCKKYLESIFIGKNHRKSAFYKSVIEMDQMYNEKPYFSEKSEIFANLVMSYVSCNNPNAGFDFDEISDAEEMIEKTGEFLTALQYEVPLNADGYDVTDHYRVTRRKRNDFVKKLHEFLYCNGLTDDSDVPYTGYIFPRVSIVFDDTFKYMNDNFFDVYMEGMLLRIAAFMYVYDLDYSDIQSLKLWNIEDCNPDNLADTIVVENQFIKLAKWISGQDNAGVMPPSLN